MSIEVVVNNLEDTNKRKLINALRKTLKYIQLGWTRGCLARDKKGNPVPLYSKRVARVCLLGAIQKASSNIYMLAEVSKLLVKELPTYINWKSLTYFNDAQKNKQPVLNLVERAIKRAKRG